MNIDEQIHSDVTDESASLATDEGAALSFESALANAPPVFVQDLPRRMTVLARLPMGSGNRELRVSTHKIKGRARVDLRFWTLDGKTFIAEHEGINVDSLHLGIFQAMLATAAKKLGIK